MIPQELLEKAIRASWTSETTTIPIEWDVTTARERGQCVPTSLVVQDYLGGEIERVATIHRGFREAHYRNLIDGEPVDFTRGQYPDKNTFVSSPIIGRTDYSSLREFMLSHQAAEAHYRMLASSVALLLQLEDALPAENTYAIQL